MEYSFDIFDTCLIRKCGLPSYVFKLLAYKILGHNAEKSQIYDFMKIRIEAEKKARKLSIRHEITIYEIYSICDFSKLTKIKNETILEEELLVEESQILPVASYKAEILKIHNMGKKIIYISDTYLPFWFVQRLLIKYELLQTSDILMLSSEYYETKSNGKLFTLVRNKTGYKTWIHTGDNKRSDVKNALKNVVIPRLAKTEYSLTEKKLIKKEVFVNTSELLLLSSISRSIRLSSENQNLYLDFAADYIAPLFVPFVYNVLKNAVSRDIKNMFFVARDGYIFYKIALAIKDSFPSLNFHYLYMSRKSLYFPCLKDISVASISAYLGDTNEIDYILYKLGIEAEKSKFKGICSKQEFLDLISQDESIMQLIKSRHKEQKRMLIDYLIQEGVASPLSSAIVDLRGTRKCHSLLNDLLLENGFKTLLGYYMEVEESRVVSNNDKQDIYHANIYREMLEFNGLYDSLHFINGILEQYFCMTPFKRTTGYERNGKVIEPVFEDDFIDRSYVKKISSINIDTACNFAKYYDEILFDGNHKYIFSIALRSVMSYFENPPRKSLTIFKSFITTENRFERKKFISKLPLTKIISRDSLSIYWLEGSLFYYYLIPIKFTRLCKKVIKKILR